MKDMQASPSNNDSSEVLKSASIAMRHNQKTQASASYDKNVYSRKIEKAQRFCEDFAKTFAVTRHTGGANQR